MKIKRQLFGPEHPKGPSVGRDVKDFVKRCLHRAANQEALGDRFFPVPKGGFDPIYNEKTENAIETLRHFQGRAPIHGPFRQDDLDALWVYADAYARRAYRLWTAPKPMTKEDEQWEVMLSAMQSCDKLSAGYLLGGGHGKPLSSVEYDDYLDCSSSSSLVLWKAGMFEGSQAIVSGRFMYEWGSPGQGERFTVYCNPEHVWIRLHDSRWWRFDTSPHADGRPSENPRRGPRLRYLPRFTSSFTARHWPGM